MKRGFLRKALFLLATVLLSQSAMADYCTTSCTQGTLYYRLVRDITLSDQYGNTGVIDVDQKATSGESSYFDKTAQTVTLKSGAIITPEVDFYGEWLHGYIYIDANNDGVFEVDLNEDGTPTTTSELVAFSAYDPTGTEQSFVNHLGESVPGSTRPAEIEDFKMPNGMAPGEYRGRLNVDWNSVDPCGSANMGNNSGAMVDFTIIVPAAAERTITLVSADETMGTVSGGGTFDGVIYCIATAKDGYTFKNWTDLSGTVVSNSSTLTENTDGDKVLTANFISKYTVSITAGENGSVSPSGDVEVAEGGSLTITVTPDDTYSTSVVMVNDEDVTEQLVDDVLTITNITESLSISVTFAATCPSGARQVPYFENFDKEKNVACWTIINANNDTKTWKYSTGGEMVYMYDYTNNADDWLISPLVEVTEYAKVMFDTRVTMAAFAETYEVYAMTSPDDIAGATLIAGEQTANTTTLTNHIYEIADFVGQDIYIGIRCTSQRPMSWNFYVDNFAVMIPQFDMATTNVGHGTSTINGEESPIVVADGSEVEFVAIPEEFYMFTGWSDADGNLVSDSNPYIVNEVSGHISLTATFELTEARTIALYLNDPVRGYVEITSPATEETSITTKDDVSIITDKLSGDYYFLNWTDATGAVISEEEEYTYTGIPSIDLTANYEGRFIVNVTKNAGGDVKLTAGTSTISSGARVLEGTELKIEVLPTGSKELGTIVVDGEDVTDEYLQNGSYTLTITAQVEIEVEFEDAKVSLSYTTTGAGYIEISENMDEATDPIANNALVTYGTPLYLYTYTYNDGELQSVLINGDESDYVEQINDYGSAEFYTNGDQEIVVTFSGESTGIEDATVAKSSVYGISGAIVIEAQGAATVYSLTGAAVKTVAVNGTATINMPQGVYIVVVDGVSSKAIVK